MSTWLIVLVLVWLVLVPVLALAVGALMRVGRGPERVAPTDLRSSAGAPRSAAATPATDSARAPSALPRAA